MPHPSVRPVRIIAERQPAIQQPDAETYDLPTAGITISAATFAATSSTTATIAQVTADPTVNVTGTGFTTACRGRVRANSTDPEIRVTTFVSTTSLTFELEAAEDFPVAGTIRVGVLKLPSSASGYLATQSTIALTVT